MSEHWVTYEQTVKHQVQKSIRIELKPCPFCGGEAEFRTGGNYSSRLGRRMGVGVRCIGCKVVTPVREGGCPETRAAELWNQRVEE